MSPFDAGEVDVALVHVELHGFAGVGRDFDCQTIECCHRARDRDDLRLCTVRPGPAERRDEVEELDLPGGERADRGVRLELKLGLLGLELGVGKNAAGMKLFEGLQRLRAVVSRGCASELPTREGCSSFGRTDSDLADARDLVARE